MKRKYLILLIIVVIAIIIGYNYIYQDHRDIGNERAAASLSSSSLVEKFLNYSQEADSLYLDKTIEISGEVTAIGESDLVLDEKVFCTFESVPKVELNSKITVKGRCIGFDDLLEEVKIDQCSIVK